MNSHHIISTVLACTGPLKTLTHKPTSTVATRQQWDTPQHSLHHIDVETFIDSTNWQESYLFKELISDGCIELFGVCPLICFLFFECAWVCMCVCIDDLKSRRGGWDAGGGRDTMIRSVPFTSLC